MRSHQVPKPRQRLRIRASGGNVGGPMQGPPTLPIYSCLLCWYSIEILYVVTWALPLIQLNQGLLQILKLLKNQSLFFGV